MLGKKIIIKRNMNSFVIKKSSYFISSDGVEIHFVHKLQTILTYFNGIKYRAYDLGNSYLLNLIDFKNNDFVIDCGSNIGDLNLYFYFNNIKIDYLAIEPSPLEYYCCKINNPNSCVLNLALSSTEGDKLFYLSNEYADSSLLKPRFFTDIISVKCEKLENIVYKNIKLLKIDAEGGEPLVILGSMKILPFIEFISVDLGFERGILCESTFTDVVNLLLKNNFEVVNVNFKRIIVLFKNKNYISFTN